MAKSPRWKVYDRTGQYQAATHELEAAAALAAFYGEGASIRDGHYRKVWIEGTDGLAADSYDAVVLHVLAELT